MTGKRIEYLLRKFSHHIHEQAPVVLCNRIKSQIPEHGSNRKGFDTINIMVHLRINPITATLVILFTILVSLFLFGGYKHTDGGLYDDLKTLFEFLPGADAKQVEIFKSLEHFRSHLQSKGIEAVFLGDIIQRRENDPSAVLMYWKLSEGQYRIIFADLHVSQAGSDELIRLLSSMIQE